MNKKDVIKWQFADGYYKLLVEKLRRIEYFRLRKNHWAEFSELESIFNDINGPIRKAEVSLFVDFEQQINKIAQLEKRFKNAIVERDKSIHHLKICNTVENNYKKEVNELYKKIMSTIYDLKMLFPEEEIKDMRGKEVLSPHG